ncbi:hybrid sensor histidine kinase/response regulator transcription factor [Seonamhaeicola marinus]|uniref:histidine kinase n=1 Tax=Seonamhaeicola marinus TaxID=1912246 RepID=A0A5D0IR36_9FLAO|nr:hybrid sensor histidine kinase/response regulator transcription factor [Seonamhaeicola marinus]TYA84172.1 response regulator [Seonamhaeicola marinus]
MSLFGQLPDLKFKHFIDEKGFNQSSVMKVIQDEEGYLWIATPNGLYKYDGQRFSVYRHESNNPNSLINNSVYELELDHQGNILIGTGKGLCKFNRITQEFTIFPKVLEDARVTAIYPEEDGGLWVGTLHSGLFHFEGSDLLGEQPKIYVHKPNQDTSLDHDQIHSITKDKWGALWVGTIRGLNKLIEVNGNKEFVRFKHLEQSVKMLYTDKKDRLWVSLEDTRLIRIDNPKTFNSPKEKNFREYSFNLENTDNDEYGGILSMIEILEDQVLLGIYGHGLYLLNTETHAYSTYVPDPSDAESLSSSNVETILLDKTNVLWVGTEEGGLNKSDLERKPIVTLSENPLTKQSLSNSSINGIAKDKHSNIWVATQNGLNKIKFVKDSYIQPHFQHYYLDNALANSELRIQQPVWSVLKDRGDFLWMGTTRGVVYADISNDAEKLTFHISPINMMEVFTSIQDREGVLWFGSLLGGLAKWEKKRKPNSNEFDFSNVESYLPDKNDKYGISGKEVSCLYEDSKGNIWIGTLFGGLNLLIRGKAGEKDKFITYQHDKNNPNSLSHNSVFSIHEDNQGNYWIGTFGGGLNKMTLPKNGIGTPEFKHYTEEDGLANNAVYGILQDDNQNLWISTDNGISLFNPISEEFKNLSKDDGLQSNNFRMNAHFKNKDGYLFFGGLRGLNIFHPENLKENAIPAKSTLTALRIKSEEIEVGKKYNGRVILNKSISNLYEEISLKHHENTLTFEFAALHFAVPKKNQFKYKLEGFDSEWIDSKGMSFAHYTNLSPRTYNFKVKASNNDGVWSDQEASIAIKINPPFWFTYWAYALYVLLVVMIFWAVFAFYRMKTQKQASLKLQKEIEEINKLKLQFFTNISHDFKTPITLILNPLEEVLASVKSNDVLKSKLKIIQRNAASLLRLVNQLMEFRKIEVGETKLGATKANIINFIREITFSFRASARKKKVEIAFESQLYDESVWFDWDKLEKILNNLIFNAIKFTPEGGRITVRVKKPMHSAMDIKGRDISVNYVQIEVEDNGIGISEEKLPYVFHRFYQVNQTNKKDKKNKGIGVGLAITKDLVDLHHGEISVESKEEIGTRFIIKLPIGNRHLLPDEIIELPVFERLTDEDIDENDKRLDVGEEEWNTEATEKNKILVVDDNEDIRNLVKEGLYKKYNIIEANNGKEALNLALKELPDLVISDVLMPEMDGIEFCYTLKTNIRTSHIPVILLTALNSVEHRIKGVESGADAYIPKPFNIKLLEVRTNKLIESRELIRKRFQTEKEITPEKITLSSLDEEFLKRIMDFMEANMNNELYWIDELARDMNTSRSTFFRKLKKLTGQSPNDFMRLVRLKRAAQLLEQNKFTIAQVSYMVGFSNPNYFGKCFRKFFGDTPSNYVKKNVLT